MKAQEVRDLSTEELAQKEQDLKEEFFNLRFQFFTGQLENTQRIKQIRKDIARVKTVLRDREIQAANGEVSNG